MRTRLVASALALALAASATVYLARDPAPRKPEKAKAAPPSLHTFMAKIPDLPEGGKLDLSELRAVVDAASGKPTEEQESELYGTLAALIARYPERVAELEAAIAEAEDGSAFARIALAALAGSGVGEAQAALVRLAESHQDDPLFVRQAVTVMGFARDPGPALVDSLRQFSAHHPDDEVRDMAVLALGGAAGRLATAEPARSQAIVQELGSALAATTDAQARVRHLGALGNVDSPAAESAILAYVTDEAPGIRAKAIMALRRTPGDASQAAVERALASDPDQSVRKMAAWTLGRRPATEASVALVARTLATEVSPEVARALLDSLWRLRSGHEAVVRAALLEAAGAHPLDDVRALAQRLVDSLAAEPAAPATPS